MAISAGFLPKLNTAAIIAGARSTARLQGLAEGSQRSGLDRALTIGVEAVKARQAALTAATSRRVAEAQIAESEQKLLQMVNMADLKTERAKLDNQTLEAELVTKKQQGLATQQLNMWEQVATNGSQSSAGVDLLPEGAPFQGMASRFRANVAIASIPTEGATPQTKSKIAAALTRLKGTFNKRVIIKDLPSFGFPVGTEDISYGEALTLVAQQRNKPLSDHVIKQLSLHGNNIPPDEAQAIRGIAQTALANGLVAEMPRLPSEQFVGLFEGEPDIKTSGTITKQKKDLAEAKAAITSRLNPSGLSPEEKEEALKQIELQEAVLDEELNRALRIEDPVVAQRAREQEELRARELNEEKRRLAARRGGETEGSETLRSLFGQPRGSEVTSANSPETLDLNDNVKRDTVPQRKLTDELIALRKIFSTLPPGPFKTAMARKIEVLEDRILALPEDVERATRRLNDARNEVQVGPRNVRIENELETELKGLKSLSDSDDEL